MRWRLDEIIDIEARIAADRRAELDGSTDPAVVDRRDRRIGAAIAADGEPGSDAAWLRAWIGRCREEDGLPGRTALFRARLVAWGVGCVVFLAGWGLGAALLAYDGSAPINLLDVLLALVGVPSLLALITLLATLPGTRRLFGQLGGPVPGLVSSIFARLALRFEHLPGLRSGLLRRREGHYVFGPLARWLAIGTVQGWAALLLIGALAALWWSALRSDLAFAWHSTLLGEGTIHSLVKGLAAPWAWLFPAAAPDAELVAHSRYVLLEGRYVPAAAGDRALNTSELHRWWYFLFMTVLVWALLPRLLFWAAARWRIWVLRGRVRLDHTDHKRLVTRLRGHEEGFVPRTPGAETDTATSPTAADSDAVGWPERPHLLRWGGTTWVAATVAECLATDGCPARSQEVAGVDADLATDRAVIDRLAADPAPVVLAVQAQEPPIADLFAFLGELRASLGPQPLTVAVVGEDPTATAIWRDDLHGAGIPATVREVTP